MNKKNNNVGDRLAGIALVLLITMCIVHPSLWIGAIGSLMYFVMLVLVAKIICRILYKKSLKELLFGDKEDK